MRCAWESFMGILPQWMRQEVNVLGKDSLQELRLRINAPPELNFGTSSTWLKRKVEKEDILFCVNTASRYSPWAASTISQGYLTIDGGHRIGLCGEAVTRDGEVTAIREVRSLNVRVARDFPGIAKGIPANSSVLILGAPGLGKTTLLRDFARQIANTQTVAVVDARCELFPEGMKSGKRMDILTGCPKDKGIDMVLRTMGPEWIAVDEITAYEDTRAVLQAANCGVRLMATAHASSMQDLRQRAIYLPLLEQEIFQTILLMHPDKTYTLERTML